MQHLPILRRLLTAAASVATVAALALPSIAPAAPATPGPRLLRSDRSSAVIELRSPAPRGEDGTLSVPGATPDVGAGDLPAFFASLGAPAGATLALHVDEGELRPAPAGLAAPESLALPAEGCTPAARITGDAWMRGQRVVTLALSPVAACAGGGLRWRPALRAELRWEGGAAASPAPDPDPLLDLALPTALLNYEQARAWRTAAAPPQALATTAATAERYKLSVVREGMYAVGYAELQAAGADVASLDPRTFRLTTRGTPVAIRVTGEQDGSFDPGDKVIFYGQPIKGGPVRDTVIVGGQLTVADTVNSATYTAESEYTDRNVYWLEAGGAPGPRMAAVPAAPQAGVTAPASFRHTARAEESGWWWTWHFTNRETWFWSRVTTSSVLTETYAIALADPDPAGPPAEVRAEFVALTYVPSVSPDHRTRLTLNGAPVADTTWDGPVRHRAAGSVGAAALAAGTNSLRVGYLKQPGVSADTIYFDWFEVTYSRLFRAADDRLRFDFPGSAPARYSVDGLSGPATDAYDVGDPAAPKQLDGLEVTDAGDSYRASFSPPQGGGSFVVVGPAGLMAPDGIERRGPSGLRSAGNGADYIFITGPELRAGTEALAAYRAAQGMRTAVVDLGEVIDEFNDGIYHPVAIKRFLAYAYLSWQRPAPQYVLLVGDGHFNLRGYTPSRYGTAPILMPPNHSWVDPLQGQVDSSNQLVSFVGDDILPDMAVGRLTARTPAEMATFLQKLTGHESAPADAAWRRRLLFLADNGPDGSGDFQGALEHAIAATVPTDVMATDKLYMTDICGPNVGAPKPCPEVTGLLTTTLNLTGTLMLTYSGHGATDRWAHETALSTTTAAGLTNADRLPFILALDCSDGFWTHANRDALIENLVRMSGGGAVGAFAATGFGVARGHEVLNLSFNSAIFQGGPQRVGPAAMAAKLALYAAGINYDMIDTYTIFGDPALRLALPEEITSRPPTTVTPVPTGGTTSPTAPTPSPTPTGPVGKPGEAPAVYLPLVRSSRP